jgi:dTDP-D-glucose 4,6-dehydratase
VNFLATGGAGFIGSHVCERLLRAGHAVWGFDDLNGFYDPRLKQRNPREVQSLAKPLKFVHGDLTNRAALEGLLVSVNFDQIIQLTPFPNDDYGFCWSQTWTRKKLGWLDAGAMEETTVSAPTAITRSAKPETGSQAPAPAEVVRRSRQ